MPLNQTYDGLGAAVQKAVKPSQFEGILSLFLLAPSLHGLQGIQVCTRREYIPFRIQHQGPYLIIVHGLGCGR